MQVNKGVSNSPLPIIPPPIVDESIHGVTSEAPSQAYNAGQIAGVASPEKLSYVAEDDLAPSRGVALGILISMALWCGIVGLIVCWRFL